MKGSWEVSSPGLADKAGYLKQITVASVASWAFVVTMNRNMSPSFLPHQEFVHIVTIPPEHPIVLAEHFQLFELLMCQMIQTFNHMSNFAKSLQ